MIILLCTLVFHVNVCSAMGRSKLRCKILETMHARSTFLDQMFILYQDTQIGLPCKIDRIHEWHVGSFPCETKFLQPENLIKQRYKLKVRFNHIRCSGRRQLRLDCQLCASLCWDLLAIQDSSLRNWNVQWEQVWGCHVWYRVNEVSQQESAIFRFRIFQN